MSDDEHLSFRRRVLHRRLGPTTVEAELEDHIHHVVVTVEHRDGRVQAVEGRGIRLPWSLCPGATDQLAELVGRPIGTNPSVADAGAHCTHLLDCAASAVRFAASGAGSHRYDMTVADWHTELATATIRRDDGLELTVRTDGQTMTGPAPFDGQSLRAGFARWADEMLDADHRELALLLRRAIWMRLSRTIDLDALDVLSDSGVREGVCFASQPQRIHVATRNRGTTYRELPD